MVAGGECVGAAWDCWELLGGDRKRACINLNTTVTNVPTFLGLISFSR